MQKVHPRLKRLAVPATVRRVEAAGMIADGQHAPPEPRPSPARPTSPASRERSDPVLRAWPGPFQVVHADRFLSKVGRLNLPQANGRREHDAQQPHAAKGEDVRSSSMKAPFQKSSASPSQGRCIQSSYAKPHLPRPSRGSHGAPLAAGAHDAFVAQPWRRFGPSLKAPPTSVTCPASCG